MHLCFRNIQKFIYTIIMHLCFKNITMKVSLEAHIYYKAVEGPELLRVQSTTGG